MAERVGIEPTVGVNYNGTPDRHLKPLGHLSVHRVIIAAHGVGNQPIARAIQLSFISCQYIGASKRSLTCCKTHSSSRPTSNWWPPRRCRVRIAPRLRRAGAGGSAVQSPRWTVSAVATELEHSSAQAFSRHLFSRLGLRPREFGGGTTPPECWSGSRTSCSCLTRRCSPGSIRSTLGGRSRRAGRRWSGRPGVPISAPPRPVPVVNVRVRRGSPCTPHARGAR